MGYTTNFDGRFNITPTLKPEHQAYLKLFAGTRRMRRDSGKTEKRQDPVRVAAGLPVGDDGGYFVGAEGQCGQEDSSMSHREMRTALGVLDFNDPPFGQPGLWCQWVPSEEGDAIVWDGVEKFYDYTSWLRYIIEHFLEPWGYALEGTMTWSGEEDSDIGVILVKNNIVDAHRGYQAMADFEAGKLKFDDTTCPECHAVGGLHKPDCSRPRTLPATLPNGHHRTLTVYIAKQQTDASCVAVTTEHGVVWLRLVAKDYPHSEDEPAVMLALDAAHEFEGEMVLNSFDLDD